MRLFECGVRYEKTLENGLRKKVTELYIVDALSFSEAERRVTDGMTPYTGGAFDVVSEKITNYSEVVSNDDPEAGKWYRVKINLMALDERTGTEKKNAVYYLIQAKDIDDARRRTDAFMRGCVADWECEAIQETKIMDVFLYEAGMAANETGGRPASQGFSKAVKDFVDGIPEGQSVTISATGVEDSVTIDKTGGETRITTAKTHGNEKQDDA